MRATLWPPNSINVGAASAYTLDALHLAVENGTISGLGSLLDPGGPATRAQIDAEKIFLYKQ